MARAGFVYLWEYRVAPDRAEAFQQLYGPEGRWVQLFRRAEGFVETCLLRDSDDPSRFITIDYWVSQEAVDRFRVDFSAEFAALDTAGEALTEQESFLGDFDLTG